jgi:alpha-beta hydrolase superfamily lysophospholipase
MRQLAEYLSGKGIATLRYDKVGTGKTGLGPYALRPSDVGSAIYTTGAKAAVRYLAAQPGTDLKRISAYAVGEGGVHAMSLATDTAPDAPKIHSLGLFQPLAGRYLDIITARVRSGLDADVKAGAKNQQQADAVLTAWNAAVVEARTKGTAPATLPEGLGAILNPSNVKAVIEADAIDPLALAARLPAGMPVLATCSDSDIQAMCPAEKPIFDALGHTALTVVQLKGVNHVLRDDPTDNVGNYAKQDPLSPQLVSALDGFVGK